MSFTEISNVIRNRFGDAPIAKKVAASLVCEEFNKVILKMWGEKIDNMASAMYLKNRVLTVAVLSSVIAGELKIRERELVNRLNLKFGRGTVDRLRFLS
jgi:hypothetical protein